MWSIPECGEIRLGPSTPHDGGMAGEVSTAIFLRSTEGADGVSVVR